MRPFNVMIDGPMRLFNEKIANDMVESMTTTGVVGARVDLPPVSKAWFNLGVGCCEELLRDGVHVLTGSPLQWFFANEVNHYTSNDDSLFKKIAEAFKNSIASSVFVIPSVELIQSIYPGNEEMVRDICKKNIMYYVVFSSVPSADITVVHLSKPEKGITPEKAVISTGGPDSDESVEVAYDSVGKELLSILSET